MSLRVRLTLLYTSLVGGTLLIFGVAIYSFVTVNLRTQMDDTLVRMASEILENTDIVINDAGQVQFVLPSQELPADVFSQVWDRSGSRQAASPPGLFPEPLDKDALASNIPIFRSVTTRGVPLRVLTVPFGPGARPLGRLQVATPATVLQATQRSLLTILIGGTLAAILFAGLASWFTTNRILRPLGDVTHTALQITRADDLSRRIPYQGPADDEVGQLIHAFNQTLSRLESLFHTQRRFMADVGHELRTPLTVIKGNVGLIRRFGEADEESMAGIENEVDRLTRLVGDLLLLAQAESGKLPLDNRLVELDTLLLEAYQQMHVLAGEKIQLRIGEIDQVLVCGDRDRLKQVVVNLVGNAISYTPPGGEVLVSVDKIGDQARLIVSDNGPGIPAEDMPHIFERFYRGEKARTRPKDGKGFGLGLSIANWIVRNHKGRIEVDSTEGQGTTFCVWLPLAQGECKEPMNE